MIRAARSAPDGRHRMAKQTMAADGGLKELVLRWFTDTQAPLILQDGNFPDWFQGLAARKEAEDVLRDKALGCFLIRLSDKAIGYILSYKGQDRCRHFVISQNAEGQFVIAGDVQLFGSLTQLIEYYKVRPIQPFGEVLTSSCCQDDADDLYDVVNAKKSSGVSVQALRSIWDQVEPDKKKNVQQRQTESAPAPAPSLPPKSRNRKLTGTVSVDASSLSQALPPVPKRGIPLGFSLSGSLPDTTPHPSETPTNANREQRLRGRTTQPSPANRDSIHPTDSNSPSDSYRETVPLADLGQVENRSRSLPYLGGTDQEEEEEEKYSSRFSSLSVAASGPTKDSGDPEIGSQDRLRPNPLYQASQAGGPARSGPDGMYAEIPEGPNRAADDTYEPMPRDGAGPGNTYESVDDVKSKKPKSTWGKNNINWKKFFPDNKKK